MKVRGIDHIHILVTDLTKATDLAEALVGGTSSEPYGGEDWNAWASYHQLGGFDLFQPIDFDKPMLGGAKPDVGAYILAFRVDDIDEAVDEVTALGLPVVSRIGSEEAGFGKLMLQAQLENYFGPQIELVERGLPDDPLHCPVPDYLDHVELYVCDIDAAVEFFTSLTGCGFGGPVVNERLDAVTASNGFGIRITAPTSPGGPVARSLATRGEGVRALGIVAKDLDDGVATSEALGLRLTNRYAADEGQVAEFDPDDFFGISIKLVQRAFH
jgi:catechol 2,3-dioxygenase-like lactoylglutathione lyase family enzyme